MKITYEDRKEIGSIDGLALGDKPTFSFAYAWFLVTDNTAQYVATHEPGTYNEDMTIEMRDEVIEFYKNYVREPLALPEYDVNTQKLVEGGEEIIDGLKYKTYVTVALTAEELEAKFKASVPQSITMRQARLALVEGGLLATINNAIAQGTDEVMKVEWEYSDEVRRDWDSLITMANGLGMTEDDLDNLFILASTK